MLKCAVPSMLLLILSTPMLLQADPGKRAARIAPYVDQQTIALLYLDFDRFEVPEAFEQLAELAPSVRIRNRLDESVARARRLVTLLKEARAEVYVVFSSSDFLTPGPYVIASLKPNTDAQQVLQAFKEQRAETCEQLNDVIYSGSIAALQRIKSSGPAIRPEFARAFVAAGDAPAQLVIAPSADHRRVVHEMLPRLPESLGGGSSHAIGDIEWVAVSVTLPPQLQIRVTSQSPTNDSALALKNTVVATLFGLTRNEAVRRSVPNIDGLFNSVVPRVEGSQLKLTMNAEDGGVKQLLAVLTPSVERAEASAQRQTCTNNLKQLALGMHIYHDKHRAFPGAASHSADGKPLLSWRVHLLPYLDQQNLYDQFHLDEPWDSEHNKQLISRMPDVFACPTTDLRAAGKTTYLVPTGPNAVFQTPQGTHLRDITDGTSNTIMIVDASPDRAIVWTRPQDLEINPRQPLAGIGAQHGETFATAFCDGSVRHLPLEIAVQTLSWLLDPRDGNVIPQDF